MIKPFRIILVLTGCIFLLTDCSKKETMEVDNETQSVVDYAIADQEFMALVSSASKAALSYTVTGIQNYTYVPTSNGMPDGKERSGMITVRLNGQAKDPGSQAVFKLVNYTASGIVYTCDSIVLTTNESNSNYTSFNVKLINALCMGAGYTIKYKFDRTFTIYPGVQFADLVTYAYGSASGTNRNNRNFSTTSVKEGALIKRANCAYISSGTMELTPESFKTRTINFGDGICDNEATFTVNENTVAFKLK